jgi:hypothetical protein
VQPPATNFTRYRQALVVGSSPTQPSISWYGGLGLHASRFMLPLLRKSPERSKKSAELLRVHSRKAIDGRRIVFDFVVGEFLLAVAFENSQCKTIRFSSRWHPFGMANVALSRSFALPQDISLKTRPAGRLALPAKRAMKRTYSWVRRRAESH